MADPTYGPLVYRLRGGDTMVVASGGEIKMESGGSITADGTQASGPTGDAAAKTAAIIVALQGVGIIAS